MLMQVCAVRVHEDEEEQDVDYAEHMFRENLLQYETLVDYECLQKYNRTNKHFQMKVMTDTSEEELHIIYHCIYRYGTHEIKLQYETSTETWKIDHDKYHPEEEKQLNAILIDLENSQWDSDLTLDEQIQIIIKEFDDFFLEVDQTEKVRQSTNTRSIWSEKDADNHGLPSFISASRLKLIGLHPPPVAPRRSRQNSVCSTQSSVRYAVFVTPPPTAPVRRRRVVDSILLHVKRKKTRFEKIVAVMRGKETITMNELGLEFLRVYDGRFNYREGHTFVMSYRKKMWSLTIDKITCVDCAVGEVGPRSVLILNYKGQCTSVHV